MNDDDKERRRQRRAKRKEKRTDESIGDIGEVEVVAAIAIPNLVGRHLHSKPAEKRLHLSLSLSLWLSTPFLSLVMMRTECTLVETRVKLRWTRPLIWWWLKSLKPEWEISPKGFVWRKKKKSMKKKRRKRRRHHKASEPRFTRIKKPFPSSVPLSTCLFVSEKEKVKSKKRKSTNEQQQQQQQQQRPTSIETISMTTTTTMTNNNATTQSLPPLPSFEKISTLTDLGTISNLYTETLAHEKVVLQELQAFLRTKDYLEAKLEAIEVLPWVHFNYNHNPSLSLCRRCSSSSQPNPIQSNPQDQTEAHLHEGKRAPRDDRNNVWPRGGSFC